MEAKKARQHSAREFGRWADRVVHKESEAVKEGARKRHADQVRRRELAAAKQRRSAELRQRLRFEKDMTMADILHRESQRKPALRELCPA
eukprot:1063855-Amphidinium_carterae.3